jgi:WD40 repeat protein
LKLLNLFLLCFTALALSADTVSTPVKVFAPHPYLITSRLFSQDGTLRVEGGNDGKVRIFGIQDTAPQRVIPVGSSYVSQMNYIADYSALLVGEGDSTLFRLDTAAGSVVNCLISKTLESQILEFSADGKKCLAYNRQDSTRKLCDLTTGETKTCLMGLKKVFAIFSPDATKLLALSPQDSTVQLRSVDNDSVLKTYRLPDTMMVPMSNAAFSPDGKTIMISAYKSDITAQYHLVFINLESDQAQSMVARTSGYNVAPYYSDREFCFSSDGTKFFAANTIIYGLWDMSGKTLLLTDYFNSEYLSFQAWFSADGASLLVNSKNSGVNADTLKKVDIATGKRTVLFVEQNPPGVYASGFSATGDDCYVGRYHYDNNHGESEWDSLVYINGRTGREFLKREYTTSSQYNEVIPAWGFASDGARIVETQWTHRWGQADFSIDNVKVFQVSDSGKQLFARSAGMKSTCVSQDLRKLCFFDTSICTMVDLAALDSVKKQFAVPDSWSVTTVFPQANLVCAFKKTQKTQFDSIYSTAGIWNMETGALINQFIVSKNGWLDDKLPEINVQFLPDGQHLVVNTDGIYGHDSISLSLFHIATGRKLFDYGITRCQPDFSLTPDGKQLLAGVAGKGVYCFDALTGKLQRFYKNNYGTAGFGTAAFSFNPTRPRQFLAGITIWELPELLPVLHIQKKEVASSVRILSATSKRLRFTMPSKSIAATMKIFEPNGRMVVQTTLLSGGSLDQSIDFKGLAHGVYMYCFETIGMPLTNRGIFMVP